MISLQQKTTIIRNRTSETAITTITTIITKRYNMNNSSSAEGLRGCDLWVVALLFCGFAVCDISIKL